MRNRLIAGTAAVLCATGGMALLWQEANTPPNVGMADRDVTWSDTDPAQAWARCVTRALTTPGMGGDADMFACDDAYVATTGDPATLWLYCPGAPEQGGCEARTGKVEDQ